MSVIAPPFVLGAVGLDAESDPHLPAGVHFRIVNHAALGLPLAPLLVYRLNYGTNASSHFRRTDMMEHIRF